jgi:hypothetical protein
MSRTSNALMGARALDNVVSSDFRIRPPSNLFRSIPPKTLDNQVYFYRCMFSDQATTNTTTITESNLFWTAATHLIGANHWLAVFDSYYLAEVWVTVANNSFNPTVSALPQFYTAYDFDNVSNVGSVAALEGHSGINCSVLGPGQSVTRYIQPCVSPDISGLSSAGTLRTWIDAADTAVPFFGYRSIVQNTPGGALSCDRTTTLVWAFRNAI